MKVPKWRKKIWKNSGFLGKTRVFLGWNSGFFSFGTDHIDQCPVEDEPGGAQQIAQVTARQNDQQTAQVEGGEDQRLLLFADHQIAAGGLKFGGEIGKYFKKFMHSSMRIWKIIFKKNILRISFGLSAQILKKKIIEQVEVGEGLHKNQIDEKYFFSIFYKKKFWVFQEITYRKLSSSLKI